MSEAAVTAAGTWSQVAAFNPQPDPTASGPLPACLPPAAARTWAQGLLQPLLGGLPAALKPLQLVPY